MDPNKTAPVVFIVFNRPHLASVTWSRIRERRPEQLFIIADGPRADRPDNGRLCEATRAVVADIDWPCEVRRNYSDVNLGCKNRVISGLDWVFSSVDRAIILEDDCVPHDDFFSYCTELLDRYEDDHRVGSISGGNFQEGVQRGDGSYFFSKYCHVWGWATWRDRWDGFEGDVSFLPEWGDSSQFKSMVPDPIERKYWRQTFTRALAGGFDSWAYPWQAFCWTNGWLSALPNRNLVENVGFGPEATHAKASDDRLQVKTVPIGVIALPSEVAVDAETDAFTFDHNFSGLRLRALRRPWDRDDAPTCLCGRPATTPTRQRPSPQHSRGAFRAQGRSAAVP